MFLPCSPWLGRCLALLSLAAPALIPAQAARAQDCPCPCAQPAEAQIAPNGTCQCPCAAVPIPGINAETLSGPPKPPKAGGPMPTWTIEPAFDDGFDGPFWDGWW